MGVQGLGFQGLGFRVWGIRVWILKEARIDLGLQVVSAAAGL